MEADKKRTMRAPLCRAGAGHPGVQAVYSVWECLGRRCVPGVGRKGGREMSMSAFSFKRAAASPMLWLAILGAIALVVVSVWSWLGPAANPAATARPVALGAPTVLNVKSFGATGNGTTNDTGAINRAIAAANKASGGGVVEFPAGTYRSANSIHMMSNVT